MAAYFESGFSVREPMWHGLGMVLDDYPTDWTDAREKAGLMWEPKLVTPYHRLDLPKPILDPMCPSCLSEDVALVATSALMCCNACDEAWPAPLAEYEPVLSHRLVVRDDTEAPLGMVSDQYSLVSHKSMGEIVEALLGVDSNVRFETAGSIRGGAQVWCLVYLDEPWKVKGDDSDSLPFCALLNSHDGTGACKLVFTRVRVVCWNTYQAAASEGERFGTSYTFRHTGNVTERIEEAKQAIQRLRFEKGLWDSEANALYDLNIDDTRVAWFLSEFIPLPSADVVSDRVRRNIQTARDLWTDFYESATCAAHHGTALGLVDAAVEYLDHARGFRTADTRLGRSLLRTEPLKLKATTIAKRVAG